MNGIDDWYVFLMHIVQSLASECMPHMNILIVVMDTFLRLYHSLASHTAFFLLYWDGKKKGLVYSPVKTCVTSYPVYGRRRLAGGLQ